MSKTRGRFKARLPGHIAHGTITAYTAYRCRCVLCSEEGSRRGREYRQRIQEWIDSGRLVPKRYRPE